MLQAIKSAIVRLITRNRFARVVWSDNRWKSAGRSRALYLYIGRGAGYIGGATLWIGQGVRGGTDNSVDAYRGRWSCGFTRNGNRVPYTSH